MPTAGRSGSPSIVLKTSTPGTRPGSRPAAPRSRIHRAGARGRSARSILLICVIPTETSSAGIIAQPEMPMEIVSENKSHGGRQLVVRHTSTATSTDMTFSIFLPPQAGAGARLPVVWYLSGLTCTHANVTEKGEYRASCAEHGLILVAPDTSPSGDSVP